MPLKCLYLFFVTTYAFKRSKKSHQISIKIHVSNVWSCSSTNLASILTNGFWTSLWWISCFYLSYVVAIFPILKLNQQTMCIYFEQSWTILKRQDNIQQHTLQPNSKNEPNMVRIWLMDWGLQFLFWIHCTVIRLTSAVLNLKLEFI